MKSLKKSTHLRLTRRPSVVIPKLSPLKFDTNNDYRKDSRTLNLPLHFRSLNTSAFRRSKSSLPEKNASADLNRSNLDRDILDEWLANVSQQLPVKEATSIKELYIQYRQRAGTIVDRVIPYEEIPKDNNRADRKSGDSDSLEAGTGVVTVIHAVQNRATDEFMKFSVCSGFVVSAEPINGISCRNSVVISCAHTLEEIHRYIQQRDDDHLQSFSFVLSSLGKPYMVSQILSSIPRSDVIALELEDTNNKSLRHLPLSPFPVHSGTPTLTHLFGSPLAPDITRSKARLVSKEEPGSALEEPVKMFDGTAWRRWGSGIMLGYRSYTGQEIEAGISMILPHILTSVLPTPGSSGGPLVNADTGCVVGMISGRRMDNRVEGERGWGTSAEVIFEMFSLPGFTPTSKRIHSKDEWRLAAS